MFLGFCKETEMKLKKKFQEESKTMSVQGITVTRGLGYGVEILNGNRYVYAVLSYNIEILIKPYIFMKRGFLHYLTEGNKEALSVVF